MATTFKVFPIVSGPLTDAEKERICELCEAGMKPWSIARQLCRHPSTVAWHALNQGYKRLGSSKPPFMRGGKLVQPFSEEEDRFITEKRIEGFGLVEIARLHRQVFPHPRSGDTISGRLRMLASDETAREAA